MPYDIKQPVWSGDWQHARTEGRLFCEVIAYHGGAEPVMSYQWSVCVDTLEKDEYGDDEVVTLVDGTLERPVTFEQAKAVAENKLRRLLAEHLVEVK